MSQPEDRAGVGSVIGDNRSMAERRAEIEEIITQHMLHARDGEFMSLQQMRELTDVERLGAYQNNLLAAVIKACRENPRQDAYFAVLLIIYVMCDLRYRVCMLSANQIASILARSERSIRAILARLIADGYIIKGDPTGRYGITPHYPALRKDLCDTGKVNPTWIMDAFAPGTIGRHTAPKLEDASTAWPDPCSTVHGSGDDPCTTVHGVEADPCTEATVTPELKRRPPLNYSSHRVTKNNNKNLITIDSPPAAPSGTDFEDFPWAPTNQSRVELGEDAHDGGHRDVDATELEPVVGETGPSLQYDLEESIAQAKTVKPKPKRKPKPIPRPIPKPITPAPDNDVDRAIARWAEVAVPAGAKAVAVVTAKLREKVRARIKDVGISGWEQMLAITTRSPFLLGKRPAKDGRAPFRATLDWVAGPENFSKIVSGNYEEAPTAAKPTTGGIDRTNYFVPSPTRRYYA